MRTIAFILGFLLFILLASEMNAQKVQYAYDAAGNRVKREISLTKSAVDIDELGYIQFGPQ
jgi:YD repeat-containing protein